MNNSRLVIAMTKRIFNVNISKVTNDNNTLVWKN